MALGKQNIFRIFIFFVGILFIIPCLAQNNNSLSELETYIENARKNWEIPGLAVAIVKNDSIILEKGFGFREYDKPAKIDEHTIFAIASNTKAFTATSLAILNDQGLLNWDDKVTDYIPQFVLYDPYVTRETTIRDLLCHRIGYKTFQGDLLWYGSTLSREEIISNLRYIEPTYSFRSQYGYSNLMFMVAGQIIPSITGISWGDFVTDSIFIPLNMDRSFVTLDQIKNIDNIATPHFVERNKKTYILKYVNWDNIAPAGSILSNVDDMAQWIKFQLNDGSVDSKQIVTKENIEEMRQLNTPIKVHVSQHEIWPTKHFSGYGLGWFLEDYQGKKILSHGGGADGMISRTVLVPEKNLGFIILTNSINYLPNALQYYFLDYFLDENSTDWSQLYLNWDTKLNETDKEKWETFLSKKQKNAPPSLGISEYTGIYSDTMYGKTIITLQGNDLYLEMLPTPIFKGTLKHYQHNTFLIKFDGVPSLPEGTVHFTLDKNGNVEKLKIDIPNPDFDFTELDFYKKDNK